MARSAQPDYGVDAPDLMRSFLIAGAASMALGIIVRFTARGRKRFAFLGPVFGLIGLLPTTLGLTMVAYTLRGKYRYRDVVLDKVAWRGDEQVLDVGTGRGLLMNGAAKRLTTGKAIGIDIWSAEDLSDNSPENALRNARMEGVAQRVEVLTVDARALSFADNTFDVVLSTYCLHNIEDQADRRAACYEIARVLKPGGVALISDLTKAGEYAAAFRQAGLTVTGPTAHIIEAHGPMWLVEAKKPWASQGDEGVMNHAATRGTAELG